MKSISSSWLKRYVIVKIALKYLFFSVQEDS